MFSGAEAAMMPMNPTSQAAMPADQGGGGVDLEAIAADLASLPESQLLDFAEAFDAALRQNDLSLEMLAGAGKQRGASRQQQGGGDQVQQQQAAAGSSGRVEMR